MLWNRGCRPSDRFFQTLRKVFPSALTGPFRHGPPPRSGFPLLDTSMVRVTISTYTPPTVSCIFPSSTPEFSHPSVFLNRVGRIILGDVRRIPSPLLGSSHRVRRRDFPGFWRAGDSTFIVDYSSSPSTNPSTSLVALAAKAYTNVRNAAAKTTVFATTSRLVCWVTSPEMCMVMYCEYLAYKTISRVHRFSYKQRDKTTDDRKGKKYMHGLWGITRTRKREEERIEFLEASGQHSRSRLNPLG
jgi:hypothetical protein